jgi:hypothetical protein
MSFKEYKFTGVYLVNIIPFVYNVGVRGFRSSMLFWLFAGGVLAIDRLRREQGRAAPDAAAPMRGPRSAHQLQWQG